MSHELEAFAAAVRVLSPKEGRAIRARFHEAFLDTASEHYRNGLAVFIAKPPGKGNQRGLLWKALRAYRRVTWDQIRTVMSRSREVFVLWDIENPNPYLPPDHLAPFERDTVIACRPAYLEAAVHLLPDDLYVFDNSFTWAGVLTHEPTVEFGELNKFLVYAHDKLDSRISTGEQWEFRPGDAIRRPGQPAVLEIWLDDLHVADLVVEPSSESPNIRFYTFRPDWTWEVPIDRLQDAIARAREMFESADRDGSSMPPGAKGPG